MEVRSIFTALQRLCGKHRPGHGQSDLMFEPSPVHTPPPSPAASGGYHTSRQAARWRTAVGQVPHFLFSPFPPPPPSFARADPKPFQPQAKMQKPAIAFPIPPRVIGRAATACTRAARVPCGMHGESGARCAHFCPKPPLKPPSKPPSLPTALALALGARNFSYRLAESLLCFGTVCDAGALVHRSERLPPCQRDIRAQTQLNWPLCNSQPTNN